LPLQLLRVFTEIYEVARWITLTVLWVACISGMSAGLFIYYHMFFWINKFDHENDIQPIENGNSLRGRIQRVGAVTWLALSLPCPKLHQWLHRQFEQKYYSANYINVSKNVLKKIQWKGNFMLINTRIFFCGFLIFLPLERFL
jgi:hypothetical protein